MLGGQQPISGATIQLYAAGTSADQSSATPLLTPAVLSDAHGAFDLDGLYTCPADSREMYLTASGGNPGFNAGTDNQASVLMLSLGPCSGLAALASVNINEVTTVASVYPLTRFMTGPSVIGASPANAALLADSFSRTNQLVDISSGLAASSTSLIVPAPALYALANSLAACVNSGGGVAGDGSPCGNLFTAATLPGSSAPADTVTAILNVALAPAANVGDIYNIADPVSPFEPALSKAPADWTLRLLQASPLSMPGRDSLLGEYLLTEGSATLAHDTSGNGNTASVNGAFWESAVDLAFNDAGQYVSLPSAVNSAQTWQFALYQEPYLPSYSPVGPAQPPASGGPGSRPYFPALLCGSDKQHLCLLGTSTGDSRSLQRFYAINTDGTESSQSLPFGWHVFTLLCGAAGSPTHYLYDGVEVAGYVQQGAASTCPTLSTAYGSGNYQVGGASLYENNSWFIGKVAAVWAWNRPLSLAEASSAASSALTFMHGKGVPSSYAPVAVQSPQILAGVDSRTEGLGLTQQQAWPSNLNLSNTSYTVVNLGVVGAQVREMCQQFNLVYGPFLQSGQPAIVVLWGGVNDILQTSQSSQSIADSLQCMVAASKAAGARVILATEVSSLSNSSTRGDDGKNSLNALLRAQAWSWGIDNLAELATDPVLGADGASANTSIFPDNLHPSAQGEPHITAIMQASIDELLGSTSTAPNSAALSAYTEVAGDRFLTLTGSNQTVTMLTCIGLSLTRQIANPGSTNASVLTSNGEVLSGSGTITSGSTAVFSPIPGSPSAAGCSWTRRE